MEHKTKRNFLKRKKQQTQKIQLSMRARLYVYFVYIEYFVCVDKAYNCLHVFYSLHKNNICL